MQRNFQCIKIEEDICTSLNQANTCYDSLKFINSFLEEHTVRRFDKLSCLQFKDIILSIFFYFESGLIIYSITIVNIHFQTSLPFFSNVGSKLIFLEVRYEKTYILSQSSNVYYQTLLLMNHAKRKKKKKKILRIYISELWYSLQSRRESPTISTAAVQSRYNWIVEERTEKSLIRPLACYSAAASAASSASNDLEVVAGRFAVPCLWFAGCSALSSARRGFTINFLMNTLKSVTNALLKTVRCATVLGAKAGVLSNLSGGVFVESCWGNCFLWKSIISYSLKLSS